MNAHQRRVHSRKTRSYVRSRIAQLRRSQSGAPEASPAELMGALFAAALGARLIRRLFSSPS